MGQVVEARTAMSEARERAADAIDAAEAAMRDELAGL